jgi:hypothetical protein
MSKGKRSILINAPFDKVAEYGKNPKEWAHWYANLSEPKKLVGDGEAGTVAEFTYSMLGMHLPMTVEVKECSSTPDKQVWVGTFTGPLSGTQTVTYLAKDNGTEVNIEIDYTVPGSILGKIADLVVIEKIQENATIATLESLKVICEAK